MVLSVLFFLPSPPLLYLSYIHSAGGVVIIWDIVARTAIHSFTNPSLTLATAIAISSDSKYIALGYVFCLNYCGCLLIVTLQV